MLRSYKENYMKNHIGKIAPLALALMAPAAVSADDLVSVLEEQMAMVNGTLSAEGKNFRVLMAEAITQGDEAGITVYAKNVGNKRLTAQFVEGDPRRTWSYYGDTDKDSITYSIDEVDGQPLFGGASAVDASMAIDNAMATWAAVQCSSMPIVNSGLTSETGVIAALNGLGGSFDINADIMHAGFTDIDFAGGVLGVTFTLVFTSGGEYTDVDNDGYLDTAFREIYYDPSWAWNVDGNNIDIESVAVHEAGHGLSQGHFGMVKVGNNGLKASPRAVMNALYTGPYRDLAGTDLGGHCGMWANW